MLKPKLILQFNEANFDFIKKYTEEYDLKGFKKIFKFKTNIITSSEKKYEHLEPWIQWYSFYTSLPFVEHQTFHLGDCLKNDHPNFLNSLAKEGKKIGIFAAMNLKPSELFDVYIPDPWTEVRSDQSLNSRFVSNAINQIVNQNARFSINFSSLIGLFIILGFPRNLKDLKMLFLTMKSFFSRSRARLAAYFDYFFTLYSIRRSNNNSHDVSLIFLNGLAHIQHHYLNDSMYVNKVKSQSIHQDPILECLRIYDHLFNRIISLLDKEYEIWIITALTQKPFAEPIYYWRFKDHKTVLKYFIEFKFEVNPRMTRDFEIVLDSIEDKNTLEDFLINSRILNGDRAEKAFGYTDSKDKNYFTSFILDSADNNVFIKWKDKSLPLKDKIDFIAKKNGSHFEKGWAFCNDPKNRINNMTIPIWKLSEIVNKKY